VSLGLILFTSEQCIVQSIQIMSTRHVKATFRSHSMDRFADDSYRFCVILIRGLLTQSVMFVGLFVPVFCWIRQKFSVSPSGLGCSELFGQ